MKKKNLIYVAIGITLVSLSFLTRRLFDNSQSTETQIFVSKQSWTCSMHPQIRLDKPGQCPICGMALVPIKSDEVPADADALILSDEAAALAHIRTSILQAGTPRRILRLYGSIQPDETRRRTLVTQVGGRIERLAVNYVGQTITEGEPLANIYSPELYNAQQELLEARRLSGDSSVLTEAVRQRLHHLKLTDVQIASIEAERSNPTYTYFAPYGGTVLTKQVTVGDYVVAGTPLFDVADLSSVWAVFEAYEKDLPFLHTGDPVNYRVSSLPDERFSGHIAFISPLVDTENRTVQVRLRTDNSHRKLKPGMYIVAEVSAKAHSTDENILIVPRSAVLWTGTRSIVYVKEGGGFKLREVELGTATDEGYVLISGLKGDDEIVTEGSFAVDAASQLSSLPSMMSPSPTLSPVNKTDKHNHHHFH